jgi:hypothetical protein
VMNRLRQVAAGRDQARLRPETPAIEAAE